MLHSLSLRLFCLLHLKFFLLPLSADQPAILMRPFKQQDACVLINIIDKMSGITCPRDQEQRINHPPAGGRISMHNKRKGKLCVVLWRAVCLSSFVERGKVPDDKEVCMPVQSLAGRKQCAHPLNCLSHANFRGLGHWVTAGKNRHESVWNQLLLLR